MSLGAYLEEECEDCGAPAGLLCRNDCPSGLTAEEVYSTREPEVPSPFEDPVPPGF